MREAEREWIAAAAAGDARALQELRDRNAPPVDAADARDGRTALHAAAAAGQQDAVRFLLAMHADAAKGDAHANGALHLAARSGAAECVALLLGAGAPAGARNKNSAAPIHLAAAHGHSDAIYCLVQHGATADVLDGTGHAPLHLAAKAGHAQAAVVLVRLGADWDVRSGAGRTPIDLATDGVALSFWWEAASRGEVARLKEILARELRSKVRGPLKPSELCVERARLQPKDADNELLRVHKALLDARGADGRTALSVAVSGGHANAVQYLLSQARARARRPRAVRTAICTARGRSSTRGGARRTPTPRRRTT